MKKYLLILFVSAGCNFSNIDYSKINIISSLVQTEKLKEILMIQQFGTTKLTLQKV